MEKPVPEMVKKLILFACLFGAMETATALTLKQAVQHALRTNPEILAQRSEYLARQQELEQARAGYLPSVDVTAGIGFERSDNNATRLLGYDNRDLTRKEAGIGLNQMLFDGFAVKSEVERQQARIDSQRYALGGTAENTGLDAVNAYLRVLREQELVKLSEQNLKVHDRIFDQIQLRIQAGVGKRSDLEQIRGRRASAASNLLADQANLQDAESGFLSVIGDLPRDLEAAEPVAKGLPTSLRQAIEVAVGNHPTLLSAKADVEAAKAQDRAARHGFYPKFNLEVGGTWNDDIDGITGRNDDLTAMVRMRYNLYAGGRDQARTRQTTELINQARDIRDRTHRQVVESMRLAWAAYEVTRDQAAYQLQHIAASEKTRDAYIKQFTLGQRTLLDVLNMENELYQARRDYASTRYDHILAQYRILVAMGGLERYFSVDPITAVAERGEAAEAFEDVATDSAVGDRIMPLREQLNRQAPASGGGTGN